MNNILYAFTGKDINSNINNQNVIYDYNIYLNSSKISVKSPDDIVVDSEFLSKHPTLEKISSDWKSWLDKQNLPKLTYVEPKLAAFVCEPVTYPLQGKLIKVGCSPPSLAETTFSDVSSNYWVEQFIQQLLQLGVIAGFLDGSLGPEEQVTDRLQEKLIKVESSPQSLAQTAETTFSDVSSNYWAAQFIQQLAQRDIIAGFPDGSFRPEESVTRAQFAAMVNKAFQKAQQRQVINFTDVPSNYWASSAIGQAYTIGFLSGYPGNRFEPNQAIPREQVLVSLANGLAYSPIGNTESTLQYFNDASNIASYARSPIAAATEKQIVVNYPNVKFLNPTATATRAQVAAFIYQALVSSNQVSAINSPYVVVVGSTTPIPGSASRDFNHP
ncbi:S-layer homology domain-containing protein [Nostoc sp.]|uniref:S-layer homology domain-containing protein n=1 Tax=Nostoc sp. TaxID=1180 RepID=UPI003FA53998